MHIQSAGRRVCRASSLPLPSHVWFLSRRPISTARRTPQDIARLQLSCAVLHSRAEAVASLNERLTMRCSERLRVSR